ncbi:MAG TPA: TatD family hydrolase [Polyangiaceae bacterium]|jgi:TatD DNase family protein|nr:TatD family hydrolase [Polyangiaceae bacterium]
MLIDTHCHLDGANMKDGPDAALERARSAGVGAFVAIGVGSLDAAREMLALSERRPDVSCTVGVHPHDATTLDEPLFDALAALAEKTTVVGIGEIGLDYHYDHSPREVQAATFRRFIALARQVKKPIVVHTRSAPADTLDVLETEGARDVGGVIHCFSEDREFARRAFDLGFDVSFSGIVTFKNATSIHEVASFSPDDRILVETDSPYLAPVPRRGKLNEPAYIVHTARRIAELRGTTFEHIEQITTENALRRFGPMLDARSRSGQS